MKLIDLYGHVIGLQRISAGHHYQERGWSKRQEAIRKSLPDGLDLMVICTEAGLSLDATLTRVSQEMESRPRRNLPMNSA